MPKLRSRVTRRRAVPTLLALALLAGCGGDDGENAAAPPPPATTAEAPAATTPPAETAPPAETQPQEQAQTTPEQQQDEPAKTTEQAPAPDADTGGTKADPNAGKDAGLDGATEAAAATLAAQVAGDYPAVKRLVSKRCSKQVTKASVEQMKTTFEQFSQQSGGKQLNQLVERLMKPEGWKAQSAGGGEAKVTAAKEAGFADLYFIREDGVWKDNTCAHENAGSTSS